MIKLVWSPPSLVDSEYLLSKCKSAPGLRAKTGNNRGVAEGLDGKEYSLFSLTVQILSAFSEDIKNLIYRNRPDPLFALFLLQESEWWEHWLLLSVLLSVSSPRSGGREEFFP